MDTGIKLAMNDDKKSVKIEPIDNNMEAAKKAKEILANDFNISAQIILDLDDSGVDESNIRFIDNSNTVNSDELRNIDSLKSEISDFITENIDKHEFSTIRKCLQSLLLEVRADLIRMQIITEEEAQQ